MTMSRKKQDSNFRANFFACRWNLALCRQVFCIPDATNLPSRQFSDAPIYGCTNFPMHHLQFWLNTLLQLCFWSWRSTKSPQRQFWYWYIMSQLFPSSQMPCMWGKTFSSQIALEQECKLTGYVICNSLTARADYWILCRWDGHRAFLSSGITWYSLQLTFTLQTEMSAFWIFLCS